MSDRDSDALLALAQGLLDETDGVLLRHFRTGVEAREKADATLVTAADEEVERMLRGRLSDAFPSHGFVGEEYGTEDGRGEARWIIDPLDATHNFVRGVPVFATLLALEREGQLVLGAVSAPALGQRWWAAAGGGAFTRASAGAERRIQVSQRAILSEAQLLFGTLRTIEAEDRLNGWLSALRGAWRDRGFGDFWGHMLVAQGSAEAMLDLGVSTWDMAAPHIIVTEAGGRMTDLRAQAGWGGGDMLSSNGLLHEQLLELLAVA